MVVFHRISFFCAGSCITDTDYQTIPGMRLDVSGLESKQQLVAGSSPRMFHSDRSQHRITNKYIHTLWSTQRVHAHWIHLSVTAHQQHEERKREMQAPGSSLLSSGRNELKKEGLRQHYYWRVMTRGESCVQYAVLCHLVGFVLIIICMFSTKNENRIPTHSSSCKDEVQMRTASKNSWHRSQYSV